ncbi:MAG: hypothetical protein O7C59_12325, partial [Rickettsia endosymbiont of Ixodes persulcatus]|nr:hypothetical protein [Rickettsia endosymbiont of Ixodes persulcatus]
MNPIIFFCRPTTVCINHQNSNARAPQLTCKAMLASMVFSSTFAAYKKADNLVLDASSSYP